MSGQRVRWGALLTAPAIRWAHKKTRRIPAGQTA
jgi:hypothetical protein